MLITLDFILTLAIKAGVAAALFGVAGFLFVCTLDFIRSNW